MIYVLDASALLAALNHEPGAERVAEVFGNAVISTVNLAEVGARLIDLGGSPASVSDALDGLHLPVVDFDPALAAATIALRASTRHAGLSLGDRACLALAIREKAVALTADQIWAKLDVGCAVELIR